MSGLMDLLSTSGTRILADPRFRIAEHGQRDGEWVHIDSDVARISLTDHHGERWFLVGPLWGDMLAHQSGAYGLMVYEAGRTVEPPVGLDGELEEFGRHLDLIQRVCHDPEAWREYRAVTAQILGTVESESLSTAELMHRMKVQSERARDGREVDPAE